MFALQKHLGPLLAWRFSLGLVLLLFVALIGNRSCYSQQYATVEIVSASKDNQVDDSDLAMKVLRDLGADNTLTFANFGMRDFDSTVSDDDKAIALIKIEAPDEINSTRTQTLNGRTATRLSPVRDFEAFCDTMDYAKILDRNLRNRYVKISINPGELEEEKLLARARKKGRGGALNGLFDQDSKSNHNVDELLNKAIGVSELGVANEFAVGDQVEVEIANKWYAGSVTRRIKPSKAELSILDTKSLAAEVSDKRLKTRLRRAKQLSLIAPLSNLRLVSRGAVISLAEREWQDASGRFSITATLIREVEGKVELRKQDGQTVKVLLKKLSEADQTYVAAIAKGGMVAEPENPFETAADPIIKPIIKQGRRLEVDRSLVKELDNSGFDNWNFDPPTISAQRSDSVVSTVDLADLPDSKRFFESIEGLDVAADGSRVLVARKVGNVGQEDAIYLQLIDTVRGRATSLIQAPKNSKILDSLPERRLILFRPDGFGASNSSRLYVYRVNASGIEPVLEWEPYGATKEGGRRKSAREVDKAWFLADNRVLTTTRGGGIGTIWKLGSKAVAEFEFESDTRAGLHIVVGPNRRMFALGSSGGVSVIDSLEGRLVGVVPSRDESAIRFFNVSDTEQIAFSDDMRRVAVVRQGALGTWDMATGELISEIWHSEVNFSSHIMWVGDFLLVDGKYVFDTQRRILLWDYKNGKSGYGGKTRVAASRLWHVPKAQDNLSSFLGSVPIPDADVIAAADSLGSPESLLLAKPGNKVSIQVNVEPQYASEAVVRSSIADRLRAAGYVVVDGETPLVAVATCKTMPRQEIRINLSKSTFDPDEWDIVTKTIVPKASGISLELEGKPIWTISSVSDIWQNNIYLEKGESLDDALKRLTTVDIDRVLKGTFPSHVAKAGEVGKHKAYGESFLNEE